MPDFCAAYGCTNARSLQTRRRGITFHKFPKCSERRRQWERALRREGFVANDRTLLCSEHFRNEDFDRTGQTIRFKAGAVPSVFNVPAHLQRPQPSTRERQRSRKRKAPDHQYAMSSSPKALKAKVDAAMATVRKLQLETDLYYT
ncbi:thap6 [Pungitius sinensis]